MSFLIVLFSILSFILGFFTGRHFTIVRRTALKDIHGDPIPDALAELKEALSPDAPARVLSPSKLGALRSFERGFTDDAII